MDRHQAVGSDSSVDRTTGQEVATNVEKAIPGDDIGDGRKR